MKKRTYLLVTVLALHCWEYSLMQGEPNQRFQER